MEIVLCCSARDSKLFVDKVDRCILELQIEPGDEYSRLRSAIPMILWSMSTAFRCAFQMETVLHSSARDSKMLLQTPVSVTPESIEIAFSTKININEHDAKG